MNRASFSPAAEQTAALTTLLAELLERIDAGDPSRLIVALHPGSGKSTLGLAG